MKRTTLGSLFDGSGGFPLAAALCGIEPVWASEVEPYPIAVTKTHLPKMKHLGSVTQINGGKVEPVNIITFGSPCQDLSVAGKRAGLKHEVNGDEETTRSGLFMEAVRIIKQMREATDGRYPSVAVWENVPGAFSSNHGEDFRTVLEELVKIVEPTAVMPAVPKGGWPYADCYCGDGWSLAYRVLDAQYIRTAQRRRRIFLVLHLTGERAAEILFERESLQGYSPTCGAQRQAVARSAADGFGADDREGESVILDDQGGQRITVRTDGVSPTLRAEMRGHPPCVVFDARGNGDGNIVPTITGDHQNRVTDYTAVAVEPVYCLQGNGIDRADTAGCNGRGWNDKTCYMLNTIDRPAVAYCAGHGQAASITMAEIANSLNCMHDQQAMGHKENICYTLNTTDVHAVAYGLDRASFNQGQNDQFDFTISEERQPTLTARGLGAVCCTTGSYMQTTEEVSPTLMARDWKDPTCVCMNYIVRRLTPTECARLQGFPDTWGHPDAKTELTDEEYQFWLNVRNTHAVINGKAVKEYTKAQMLKWYNKLHTDSAEYKMWGNGVALPCVQYVMEGIADALRRDGVE